VPVRCLPCTIAKAKADQDYKDKVAADSGKLLHPSQRFGRGGASYSLRQIFEP